ncbi:ABC transporter substrate-binding protein [Paenibacillus maysiensis]|uniref:ABC transporter substrate-binding protein n=1 Tax=Paenibacillus maysiensis TaxID=1155954 RepID=UPI00047230D7|nr:extracellular solute-binding protein [Paenibacillus maysiensis]
MKRVYKGISLILAMILLMSMSLVACSGSKGQSSDGTGPVTLKVMLFGEKPVDMEKVLTEFNNRTKDTLKTKLNIEWNPSSDHKQKVKLKMAAGESVDVVFDAPWMNMYQNISQGYYLELDKYFNNDAYPGLKKAFSPEFLESNKVNGHLYTVPFTQLFYDIEVIYIRKDLREKYGLKPIQSYDDLEVYLEKVQQNDPSMIPFGNKGERGFFKMFAPEEKYTHVVPTVPGAGAPFNIILSKDGKKVLGATTIGDPDSAFSSFPAPYNDPDYFYKSYDQFVKWNRFIQKDVLSEKDPALLLTAGKLGAMEGTLNSSSSYQDRLTSAIPGAELETFVYDKRVRNMEKGAIGTDYRAWNFIALPVTSENADRTMKFLDWLFASQENHDLFELGIKGEHWQDVGDNKFKTTDKSANYVFPMYELTWNPVMSRINASNDPETTKYLEYAAKDDTYYKLPLAGFTFNTEKVKTQIAKVQPKYTELEPVLKNGLDANWRQRATEANKEMQALGLEDIRKQVIEQAQKFLDNQGQ